jgi:hypothetical protein
MKLFLPLLFVLIGQISFGQSFIKDYKDFYRTKINQNISVIISTPTPRNIRIPKRKLKKAKKASLKFLNHQVKEFEAVFQSYRRKTGFNFNTADSVTIIYQTGIETNLRDFLIYSGKDTITYGELWFVETGKPTVKTIFYKPFLDTTKRPSGYKVIGVRDSLLNIASLGNCGTVQLQLKDSKVFDGSSSTILKAKTQNGTYFFEECSLPPFDFVPIWRKE